MFSLKVPPNATIFLMQYYICYSACYFSATFSLFRILCIFLIFFFCLRPLNANRTVCSSHKRFLEISITDIALPHLLQTSRSHQIFSFKKGVLKDFTKSTGKNLCRKLCFNKVVGLRSATLWKKRLQHRYFFCEFCEDFYRTPPGDYF